MSEAETKDKRRLRLLSSSPRKVRTKSSKLDLTLIGWVRILIWGDGETECAARCRRVAGGRFTSSRPGPRTLSRQDLGYDRYWQPLSWSAPSDLKTTCGKKGTCPFAGPNVVIARTSGTAKPHGWSTPSDSRTTRTLGTLGRVTVSLYVILRKLEGCNREADGVQRCWIRGTVEEVATEKP